LPITGSFIVGRYFCGVKSFGIQYLTFAPFYFLCSMTTSLSYQHGFHMYYCLHRPQHLGIAAEGIEGTDIILGKKSVQKHQHKTTTSQPTGTKLYTLTLQPMLFFAQYRCLRTVHCVNLQYIQ
jgi:hypothetical protein